MGSDDRVDVLVSLQDGAVAASAGHLALGALVGPDRVVLDLPPDLAIGDDVRPEVLISPIAPRDGDVIERIRPLQILIRSLDTTPSNRVALVPLAQDSRYGAALPRITRDEARTALEDAGEIWAAMERLRVVPAALRRLDPLPVLERIAAIEVLQRSRLIGELLSRRPDEIVNCPFSPNTECERGGFMVRGQQ